MSAFICSDLHQFVVADFIVTNVISETENPQQLTLDLANKLKRINVDSVNYRYQEKTKVYKVKLLSTDYLTAASLSLHDKAKLAKSWIYQSCEDSSLDYFAYSALIEQVIKASKANHEMGTFWSI
jgi:hypothetical protein